MGALSNGDLAGAGLSPAQAKAVQSDLSKIMKDAQASIGPSDSSGAAADGGGYSLSASATTDLKGKGGYGDSHSAAQGPGKNGGPRGPANVAGMKRLVNGEAIGVAADSIFDMVRRRYDLKGQQNSFVTPQ